MPTTAAPTAPFVANRADALRIVPMHGADAGRLASTTPPQLTYRNGPLLTAVEVYTIFWGSAWQDSANAALLAHMNDFFDHVLTSGLMDQLAEYGVPGQPIGHGRRTGTLTITTPAPGSSVTDSAVQHLLQGLAASHPDAPKPTPNPLYFVYLPPGVRVVQGGSASCQAFCGYHSDIAGQLYYAVMPFPGCAGCTGGLAPADALTSTSSHELCEAVTDPIPGQGWYDDSHGEIGDICAWKTRQLGGYTVQLEWSNRAGQCV